MSNAAQFITGLENQDQDFYFHQKSFFTLSRRKDTMRFVVLTIHWRRNTNKVSFYL